MFRQKCPQNCLLMFLAVYLVKTSADTKCVCVGGGGGSHPFFRQMNIKKYHRSSKIAENEIKAIHFAQSCTMVY